MRVLMVSPLYPVPISSGGATRIANLVRELGPSHELHMLALLRQDQTIKNNNLHGLTKPPILVPCQHNITLGERLADALHPASWHRTMRRSLDRLKGQPLVLTRVYLPEFERQLRKLLQSQEFDVVQLMFTEMGRYLPLVRRLAPRARVLLEEIDIAYVALERTLNTDGRSAERRLAQEVERLRRFEQTIWPQCDGVVVMSDVDRGLVAGHAPDKRIWTVPNGVDPEYFAYSPPSADSQRVLFLGFFRHPPNAIGLRYFLREVWPGVRAAAPGAALDIVGDMAPPDVAARDGRDGIKVHGFVPDVRPRMAACRATVVPILTGGGTRLKVLEALSAGLPVVSTAMGCEGIAVRDGEEVLLGDTPAAMTEALVRVLTEHSLALRLAAKARACVEARYAWKPIAKNLEEAWGNARSN